MKQFRHNPCCSAGVARGWGGGGRVGEGENRIRRDSLAGAGRFRDFDRGAGARVWRGRRCFFGRSPVATCRTALLTLLLFVCCSAAAQAPGPIYTPLPRISSTERSLCDIKFGTGPARYNDIGTFKKPGPQVRCCVCGVCVRDGGWGEAGEDTCLCDS